MNHRYNRERLLASTMICGALFAGGLAGPAFAQDEDGAVAEIVVTGTRIPTPNLESVSPVVAIGAADIKAQGVIRVEDMINSLPQAFASQGSTISNGSNGTATVNLRGLGPSRTLVLINGRRLNPGNPTSAGTPVADLNFIPSALIERVDVATGGGSAVYGADAVAGVVNFIMQKNFEGIRLDAQISTYQHQNDNPVASIIRAKQATAAIPGQFALPKENVRDGAAQEVTLTVGVSTEDDRGNITAYASYRHASPILQSNRDFSACSFNSGAVFTCGGSGTAYPARFGSFIVDPAGPGNTFRVRNAATDIYNFGPTNFYQRPDERYTMGAFAHYELSEKADIYTELMFMDDVSTAQIAPGGIFAANFSTNCDNPLMTAVQQGQLCGAAAGTPTIFTGVIARRNIEGGGRQSGFHSTSYRIVVGSKGDLGENWNYDLYGQFGSTSVAGSVKNFFHSGRIQNALFAKRNAAGQIVCQSVIDGSDPACVPYNIFTLTGVTPAALNYLSVPSYANGTANERVVSLSIGGDLTEYGVKSPWSEEGVGVAFGTEYRREHMDLAADFLAANGLISGAGGAVPPIDAGYDVYELFGEARIPIANDMPWAKSLQLEVGYRYSDYSFGSSTDTYKFGGDWVPVDGLRLRASYQRAVRAPNLVELYGAQVQAIGGSIDPCAGLAAGNPLVARCAAAFNLTTAQVLAIEPNPADQYMVLAGGNANVQPEVSDTVSFGLVATPSFLPGFNFSIDYFDIKVEEFISTLGANNTLNRCVLGGEAKYCALVQRDAQGSLWLSPNGPLGRTIDLTENTGYLRTSGVDFSANYRTDLDELGLEGMGGIQVNFVGTWLDKLETALQKGDRPVDCAGYYGSICGNRGAAPAVPSPVWRHKARLTWNTPLPWDLSVSAQWRYFSEVKLDATSSDPELRDPSAPATDLKLASRSYFDLMANWTIAENYTFRAGVNNVLDKDPPLNGSDNCLTGPCNGNTWPQVYDALGRFLFLGVTAKF
ncbi:TonB-dependent receptor domain-containing protein [Phenylobacterium sp.]|uniref:TonB-dependent receptor domain-containing protein n=1 Tax=Phenylobacterium sp. TaxID=1871053 RepID=UPI0027373338|nr:TonB-dependent receptor [Phenylobacterium sp.]MDP3855780.1 TonB-dependent receptor [Phenylobacterium sp.]